MVAIYQLGFLTRELLNMISFAVASTAVLKTFAPKVIKSSNDWLIDCYFLSLIYDKTKTYDAVTEKFMDFSFEKTHSAYMLFYERCDPNEKDVLAETPNIELSQELADWIWHDNIQFLHDKHVFDTTYFNFMWLICSNIPPSVPESNEVVLSNVQLGE